MSATAARIAVAEESERLGRGREQRRASPGFPPPNGRTNDKPPYVHVLITSSASAPSAYVDTCAHAYPGLRGVGLGLNWGRVGESGNRCRVSCFPVGQKCGEKDWEGREGAGAA